MATTTPTTLNATVRTENGKGASRRARHAGHVPAVVYGPGKPAVSIIVAPKDLAKVLTGKLRRNQLLSLDITGQGKRTVMVKDMQSHPVKRVPTHVDFIETAPDARVAVKIPIEVTGKSAAVGQGAKLTLIVRTVTLEATANNVPEKVIFDVTGEGFGVIRAKQIKLPEGTKLVDAPETPLISLKIPRGDKEEEAAAAAAAAAPAEGAAAATGAAPAAGAKGATPAAGAAAAAPAAGGDKKKK
jgi:large subunit ribosomal protein L25